MARFADSLYVWMRAGATLAAGVGLLWPATLGLSGDRSVLHPLPLLTVAPAVRLSPWSLEYAALGVPTLLFFAWHPLLFRGEARVPRRSYFFLALVIVLNTVGFVADWQRGLQYQGAEYTWAVCLINIAWAVALAFGFGLAWKKGSSFWSNLLLHWMLFAWLAWYAFPYLGEMP